MEHKCTVTTQINELLLRRNLLKTRKLIPVKLYLFDHYVKFFLTHYLVFRKGKVCNPWQDGTFVVTGCPGDVKFAVEKIKAIAERYTANQEKYQN